MKITSEQEMIDYGKTFSEKIKTAKTPLTLELIGDVGAGKTTFVRGLAEGLGIKEPITSPSFTISKTYAYGDNKILTHYDFYRLPDPGLMQEDLEESIKNSTLTIVEWANSVSNILPENRLKLEIKLNEDNSREVTLK
ncbi:MAG: tRNA (adenosine(37)-N6)-threonylcarbamoyltransferase complex ATPase subunit type 1 TsaE [Candidatus Saccharibacteria bacterium]|nr:tRNA (adenosine(37)-N6)-threonylcarbamoyltransferase complex ATPase subunit type 1 TsaE [Candidatus Saccharibacteria bacterium]